MYRINRWFQDTNESGYWILSGSMSKEIALSIGEKLEGEWHLIVDESYAVCKNCTHRADKECMKHKDQKICMDDTCNLWEDYK